MVSFLACYTGVNLVTCIVFCCDMYWLFSYNLFCCSMYWLLSYDVQNTLKFSQLICRKSPAACKFVQSSWNNDQSNKEILNVNQLSFLFFLFRLLLGCFVDCCFLLVFFCCFLGGGAAVLCVCLFVLNFKHIMYNWLHFNKYFLWTNTWRGVLNGQCRVCVLQHIIIYSIMFGQFFQVWIYKDCLWAKMLPFLTQSYLIIWVCCVS